MENPNANAYAQAGVDYTSLDPFKLLAQEAGVKTSQLFTNGSSTPYIPLEESRGESAYLIEAADRYIALVEEGLGTKNIVADEVGNDRSYYESIAQDTVAMIVNDLITVGALPIAVAMHLAVGDSAWFDNQQRASDLIRGWSMACMEAGCVWGGGETPTLKGIVVPETCLLSGSAWGDISPKERRMHGGRIKEGDAIILLASSGIHANGLTLARKIAERLPAGYGTRIDDSRTYGEALLEPTIIYVPLMRDLFREGIQPHYAANITGHGWKKLMRATQPFTYVIDEIPEVPPVLRFIQERAGMEDVEAYETFNMGAGFALFCDPKDADRVCAIARSGDFKPLLAGCVEKGEKKVLIRPKSIEYSAFSLAVRA